MDLEEADLGGVLRRRLLVRSGEEVSEWVRRSLEEVYPAVVSEEVELRLLGEGVEVEVEEVDLGPLLREEEEVSDSAEILSSRRPEDRKDGYRKGIVIYNNNAKRFI